MLASIPLDFSDLEGEKERETRSKLPKTDVSTYIQQELNREFARILKGKLPKTGTKKQQHVNFIHMGEFAGDSHTNITFPVLVNSWMLYIGAFSHLCCDKDYLSP